MTEAAETHSPSDFSGVKKTLAALPVAGIADGVVASVKAGKVTVVAAPTGSGKSMMLPAALADASDHPVVVLVPRRFLAIDAASNVAAMAGTRLGEDVGYAIGEIAGEKSQRSDKTRLLFTTYGYAIASGLINTAQTIVLDEVHEAAEDMSLARAILYDRKQKEPELQLLEMSATVDASRQSAYWKPVADTAVHQAEGQRLQCEERRATPGRDAESMAQLAVALLQKEGRKGIALFKPGVKEVERTAEELTEALGKAGLRDVEVAIIHGSTPPDERARALAPPAEGKRKVIVGTNVIESGMNLRWVDAGISDGQGKIPYDREDTGAYALVLEHLPQWRVVQQRGRVNRAPDATGFDSGIFILHSNREMEHRPQAATPELQRRSLRRIAFRAASLGYVPDDLHFDADVSAERLQEAKDDLVRLGLVDENWSLTDDGEYVSRLPLSPEAGAVLCEARRLDVAVQRSGDAAAKKRPKLLGDAIVLAALVEQGGIREDYRRGHGLDGKSDIHGGSDVLDGLKAYRRLEQTHAAKVVADSAKILSSGDEKWVAELEKARENLKAECGKLNVSYTDFSEVMLLVGEIRARHRDAKSIEVDVRAPYDEMRYNGLKQALLNGSAHRLFARQEGGTYRDLLRDFGNRKNQRGDAFNGYALQAGSVVHGAQEGSQTPLLVGELREFPPKLATADAKPELVIDQATSIPAEVFVAWAAGRERPLLSEVELDRGAKGTELSARYDGRAHFSLVTPPLGHVVAAQLKALSGHGAQVAWR